jgi:hypothetical protein
MLERIVLPIERTILKGLGVNFVSRDFVDKILENLVSIIREDSSNFRPELVVGIKNAGVYASKKISEGLHLETDYVEANREKAYFCGLSLNDRFIWGRLRGTYSRKEPVIREEMSRTHVPKIFCW